MSTIILLLALFFCHFLADYTHLSTAWMLNAKRFGKPLFPIFCHALIHAFLMAFTISMYLLIRFGHPFWHFTHADVSDAAFFIQLFTHFGIDVWKGKMNVWFPSLQSPANKWHWIVFGFDQFLHASVIIIIVYIVTLQP